jgi:hypothetical protein
MLVLLRHHNQVNIHDRQSGPPAATGTTQFPGQPFSP